jgi:hypothetical protein
MLVVGISKEGSNSESEEEEEDEEGKEDSYTVEQVGTLRHILINDARDEALNKALDFASGGQATPKLLNPTRYTLHPKS